MDGFVYDQVVCGGVVLIGSVDCVEYDVGDGQFQVGGFIEDDCVVVVQFQQVVVQMMGNFFGDCVVDLG